MITFKQFLEEAVGPFRHAYQIDNSVEQREADRVYAWVADYMQCTAPAPQFWVVGHHHMQDAAQRVSHYNAVNGQVFGWFSQTMPDKVFLSDKLKLRASKKGQAVLAHELAHYCQWHTKSDLDMTGLEHQADEVMARYVQST